MLDEILSKSLGIIIKQGELLGILSLAVDAVSLFTSNICSHFMNLVRLEFSLGVHSRLDSFFLLLFLSMMMLKLDILTNSVKSILVCR